MVKLSDLSRTFKIGSLLEGRVLSKDAKKALNELSVLASTYAITVLSEICKDREATEEDVRRVFESLKP